MKSLLIQFHATPAELGDMARAWLETPNVHALALHTPFRVERVSVDTVREVVLRPNVYRLLFTEGEPNPAGEKDMQLLDNNSSALLLDLGRQGERGLL